MSIFTIIQNDDQFTSKTINMSFQYSMSVVTVSIKQLLLWRSSIDYSVDKEQFDKCIPFEKFYEEFLGGKHKDDALAFFEGELEHVTNLKPTTTNPLVLKMLEDQITLYSEAIQGLNK